METLKSCLLVFIWIVIVSLGQEVDDALTNSDVVPEEEAKNTTADNENLLMNYRRLLNIKISDITQAVFTVKKMPSYEKQYQMLSILMDKIFKVLLESKVKLTEAGYVPTDGLPSNATILDTFSLITENTIFMGRFALELPDQVHEILNKHSDWKVLIQYGIGFCTDSNVLSDLDLRILNLAAQELNLIDREQDYVNPNSKKYQLEQQMMLSKAPKTVKKTKTQKVAKKKGPKLSGPRHSEL